MARAELRSIGLAEQREIERRAADRARNEDETRLQGTLPLAFLLWRRNFAAGLGFPRREETESRARLDVNL